MGGGGGNDDGDVRGTYTMPPAAFRTFPRGDRRRDRLIRLTLNLLGVVWALSWVYLAWRASALAGVVVLGLFLGLLVLALRVRAGGISATVTDSGIEMRRPIGRNRLIRWSDVASIPESGRYGDQLHLVMRDGRLVYVPAIPARSVTALRGFAESRGAGGGATV